LGLLELIPASLSAYAALVSAKTKSQEAASAEKDSSTKTAPKKGKAIGFLLLGVIIAVGGFWGASMLKGRIVTLKKPAIVAKIEQGETRNLSFGGYKWRVLDVQSDRALLITEDVIEKHPYNNVFTDVTWEDCTRRIYLNGEFFYRTFSEDEQEWILEVTNENADNQWYGTKGGNPTKDRVFLLSIEEVVKYFGDSGDLKAHKGWYWEDGKDVLKDGKGYYINDQYNINRLAKFNNNGFWWWLRSPGGYQAYAAYVRTDGSVDLGGGYVVLIGCGVRPALWLNL
jgi:hypothetical protein